MNLTSAALQRVLTSYDGYKVLGDHLNSWTQGGCWTLAQALREWIGPRAAMYCVRGRQRGREIQIHHVLVRVGDFYIDGEGIDRRPGRVKKTWTRLEGLKDVTVETFLPRYRRAAIAFGIECPPAAVKRVVSLLKKNFGDGAEATAWMGGEEVRPNPSTMPWWST